MIARKIQNSGRCSGRILVFCRGRILNLGIKEVMIASKIQNSAAVVANLLNSGIKEVMVVRNLDFADWAFPESAAAPKKQKYNYAGCALL